jgi:hypothetical protein
MRLHLLFLAALSICLVAAGNYDSICDPIQQPDTCTTGTLNIRLYPPSATADLYVDGALAASASSQTTQTVPAGAHQVEARNVVGGYATSFSTTVFAGWTRNLTLDVSTPPDPQLLRNSYSWRFGIGVPNSTTEAQWVSRLGAGWWYDWRTRPNTGGTVGEYWQMIRLGNCTLNPSVEEFTLEARRKPGQVWMIGNEPDVAEQDNVSAECVADLYHEAYTALKAADPTAKVAMGGVAQASPLRLKYLESVLDIYAGRYREPMPVDIWTVHAYILREAKGEWGAGIPTGLSETTGTLVNVDDHDNINLFKGQVVRFREWMAEHGYRDVPLVISEFGILMPPELGFTPERVEAYMFATFDYLISARDSSTGLPSDGNRLVQRWAWFSMSYEPFPTSDLYSPTTTAFTDLGNSYRSYLLKLK